MDQTDWPLQIVRLVDTQRQLASLDGPVQTYTYHRPRQGATEEELTAFERQELRASLPTDYRTFLSVADGWESFWQNADLFGLFELTGGGSGARGQDLLEHHATIPDIWATFGPDDVMPIGAARDNFDLFVLGRAEGPIDGLVVWLANEVIEQFRSFSEFFEYMVQLHERRRDRQLGHEVSPAER
jgi:hypothetical protein